MSTNKKSNDATEKKGMALSDDALSGVTGGDYVVTYKTPYGVTRATTFSNHDEFLNWAKEHRDYDIISKKSIWLELIDKGLKKWLG